MHWRLILGIAFLFVATACFENTPPIGDTGSQCTDGTEGCPCIDGECVGALMCLSSVCVDPMSNDDTTSGNATTASNTTTTDTGPGTTASDDTEVSGDVSDSSTTTSGGDGIPNGQNCDPLDDLCDESLACVGIDAEGLFCTRPGSSGLGEECAGPCAAGLVCMGATEFTDCDFPTGCCAAVCSVFNDSTCPPTLFCVAVYQPGSTPDGYEHVGVCIN